MGNNLKHAAIALGSTVVATVTGCTLLTLPSELPQTLESLLADAARYQVADSWPLQETSPGTVVDPLGDLAGCWAVYYHVGPPQTEIDLELAEVLQFDADAGVLTRSILHRSGSYGDIRIQRGTYTLSGPDRFNFSARTVQANMAGRIVDVTDKYETLPEYTVYATRSGDYLKLRFEMPAGNPRTPGGFLDRQERFPLIHRRFDCPVE